jgi:peptidoglycan/xylan/chitin deacetylase (PgdA/CDA1 family)
VSLPPAIFRDQLSVLADAGARGISVSEYVDSRRAGRQLEPGTIVLTFDDAYRDFVDEAFPRLQAYGWRATVFVPVTPVDADRPWDCGDGHPRRLLTWQAIQALATAGIEFAAHSMTHRDLTRLAPETARDEIERSGRCLSERTGRPAAGFGPPLGRSTPALRRVMAQHYTWSAGATLARATEHSDLFDLPRIEMWYFRDIRRWRRYVEAGWTPYFELRRILRAARAWM